MNADFTYMMYLAGCGAQGVHPAPPAGAVQWERVLRYAYEQSVDDLVSFAVTLADFQIPTNIRNASKQKTRENAVINTVRRMGILGVLADCKKEGLKVAVLKGIAISADYAFPEVRSSADTDLYVSQHDEAKVLAIFVANGFTHRPRMPADKDTHLFHPQLGCVELHIRLFEPFIYKLWYKGVATEPMQPLLENTAKDGAYYTFEITDHLIFVILHMMKHFIVEGCSLKMLLDIGVMLISHDGEIDYRHLLAILENLRYARAIQLFLRILCMYCGMDLSGNPLAGTGSTDTGEAIEDILEDMETGGMRGYKDENHARMDGMRVYNAAVLKRQKGGMRYRLYLRTAPMLCALRAVFPPRQLMIQRYTYLKARPWLYPVACLHRIRRLFCTFGGSKGKKVPELRMAIDADTIDSGIGMKRIQMFRNMKML